MSHCPGACSARNSSPPSSTVYVRLTADGSSSDHRRLLWRGVSRPPSGSLRSTVLPSPFPPVRAGLRLAAAARLFDAWDWCFFGGWSCSEASRPCCCWPADAFARAHPAGGRRVLPRMDALVGLGQQLLAVSRARWAQLVDALAAPVPRSRRDGAGWARPLSRCSWSTGRAVGVCTTQETVQSRAPNRAVLVARRRGAALRRTVVPHASPMCFSWRRHAAVPSARGTVKVSGRGAQLVGWSMGPAGPACRRRAVDDLGRSRRTTSGPATVSVVRAERPVHPTRSPADPSCSGRTTTYPAGGHGDARVDALRGDWGVLPPRVRRNRTTFHVLARHVRGRSRSSGPCTWRASTVDRNLGAWSHDPVLHPFDELVERGTAQPSGPLDASRAVAGDLLGDVGVHPERLGAGRRPGRVSGRGLPDQQERSGRKVPDGQLGRGRGQLVDRVGDVDRAGPPGPVVGPADRLGQRVVDLHRPAGALELPHPRHERIGQGVGRDELGRRAAARRTPRARHGAR